MLGSSTLVVVSRPRQPPDLRDAILTWRRACCSPCLWCPLARSPELPPRIPPAVQIKGEAGLQGGCAGLLLPRLLVYCSQAGLGAPTYQARPERFLPTLVTHSSLPSVLGSWPLARRPGGRWPAAGCAAVARAALPSASAPSVWSQDPCQPRCCTGSNAKAGARVRPASRVLSVCGCSVKCDTPEGPPLRHRGLGGTVPASQERGGEPHEAHSAVRGLGGGQGARSPQPTRISVVGGRSPC